MYLLILPGFIYFVVFRYIPLFGYVVAFQEYSPFLGFRNSPFVGLENFVRLFNDPAIANAIKNTLAINALQLIFFFPAPIILALMLNSMTNEPVKRFVQSTLYLPHFMSWVIIISLWQLVLGGDGAFNQVVRAFGGDPVNVMTNPDTFWLLVVLQNIWKEAGWGTIIFLAALSSIDVTLYEAAMIDGANKWRRLWHITLPGIRGVIALLLVLRLGEILDSGFIQILLQRDAVGPEVSEVLDTFVYYRGIVNSDYGYSTAANLLKGVVGMLLILAANRVSKRLGEEGVF